MEDYLAGHRQFLKKASFVNKAALFKDAEEDAEGTENSGSETPSGGSDIIFPNAMSWTDGFEVLRRHTAPDLAGRNLRVLQHQGTSSHDRTFAHLTVVEERRPHADEGTVVDAQWTTISIPQK